MIPTSTRLSYANGYLDLGMTAEAAAELDAIPPIDLLEDDVLALRTRLYLETQNWELLAAVAQQLATQAPEFTVAWIHWAYALRELDRNDEAKTIALRGLTCHPKEAILWFNLACYCSLLGELQDASDHLDTAIKLEKTFEQEAVDDPDLTNLWNWLKSDENA